MELWLFPAGSACSSVIRPGLEPWFGRISDGLLVLDGCFVVLSVAASVSTTDVAPVSFAARVTPVDDIVVVDSAFVVDASLPEVSSELQ